ncbi:hypothetical protein ASF61_16845 [Duganella sp. Leaf126]|nr:hypothetical protein ASF61_16845 [Duganella sp. Leaf126]
MKPYAQRPANAIVTFDAGVEVGLIAAGKATADLTGGVRYFMPRPGLVLQAKQVAVGAVALQAEEQTTITLPEGQVLLISAAASTAGAVSRAGSSDTWSVAAGALAPIGPYAGMQRFLITCTTGAIAATVREAVLAATGAAVATIAGTGVVGQPLTATLPAGVVGTLQFTKALKASPFTKSNISGAVANAVNSLSYTVQAADALYNIGCDASSTVASSNVIAALAGAATAPGQPAKPVLTAMAGAVSVAWTPGAAGSTATTGNIWTDINGNVTQLTTNPQTITAPAGTPYTGTVSTVNAQGAGPASAQADAVTPTAVPSIVPFDSTAAFPAGQQVTYAGGLYTFTAAHPAGNWTGADVTYNGQSGTRALNTVGMSKPLGVVSSFTSGGMDTTTTTAPSGSRGGKCQMEAPFTKLRVMRYQREAAPTRGFAISVASTETDSASSISNAVDPIVGGVPYSVPRASSPYGFARATWNGQPRSPVQPPAGVSSPGQGYVTHMSTAISDWVDCASVPPLNNKLPMVVFRYNGLANAGDVGSNANQGTLGAMYNAYINGTATGRFLVAPSVGAGDHVADPTLSRAGATMYDPTQYNTGIWQNIAFCAEHGIPTRVVAGFGDSITEGYSWWQNAVYTLSTQKAPCYVVNFGCSTNRAAQYLELLKTQLREENYITDVLLPSFSPNEVQAMTSALADGFIAGLQDAIELCRVYNKRLYIWTSYAAKTTRYAGNSTAVNAIKKINDWVRTEAAKQGAQFNLIEIENGWDNASMIVTANSDNTHPNATAGIPYMTSRCLPAIQLGA